MSLKRELGVFEPHRIIPQAIIITLAVSMLIYIGVAIVAMGAAGEGA